LSVCRQVRAATDIPIIFLTALVEDTDRIIGLELGADDYVVKPFNPRELLARIRAVLRRASNPLTQQRMTQQQRAVRIGQWRVNMGRQEISGSDGVGIPLSTAEFRLLKVFIERPGLILSREQLLDLTVGRTADIFDRSIDNQVSRLRKKIEENPKNPSIIKTHWGGGYSLAAEVAFE
jgi:two-component system OmpR family response regulator